MATKKFKVGIVGLGMVGTPIRRWFEENRGYKRGVDLFCYDADSKKGFSDDVNKAELIFVAVPTPSNKDGSCNTKMLEQAVGKIADNKIVVVKSTIPPGTVVGLQQKYPKKHFIFNPEFLTESKVWEDFIMPSRQVLGSTKFSKNLVAKVIKTLPSSKEFFVSATEAELSKYASNVFGYIKVVYANILADVSHGLGVDYDNVKNVMSADPRIGSAWLEANYDKYAGVGGYCFPKDMNAFIHFAENLHRTLAKQRKKNPKFLVVFKKGIEVLKAVRSYNEVLIAAQGLTMSEVMLHNKEIRTAKVKPLRSGSTDRSK